ncbi:hypothetical protein K466DRAFT_568272 [Polyporus arcularius HHB13444]|uniref:Uncharacterized protein n=1 Tax=Polyporus arcularius HHB13444 TaxID=1314778 RepID=A0A5C3NZL9_9APHY|nr:hypothetical protein K466DRAFT_568272 [Polyporus arcularius HHB13444]
MYHNIKANYLSPIWNVLNLTQTECRFVEPIKSSQTFGGFTAPNKIPEGDNAHAGLGRHATFHGLGAAASNSASTHPRTLLRSCQCTQEPIACASDWWSLAPANIRICDDQGDL